MEPAADDRRVFGPELAGGERLADRLEEVSLALLDRLGAFGPRVGREAGGEAEGGQLAAVRLGVGRGGILEQGVPRLRPRPEAGGLGQVLVEPARGDEPVVVRGRRRELWRPFVDPVRADLGVMRQVDEHRLGAEGLGRLHRDIFGRIDRQRIPRRELGGDVRRGAEAPVEAEHVVVVAIGRVDRDRRLGLPVDDVADQVVRLGRPLDEHDLRLSRLEGDAEEPGDGRRVVADREPVERLGEHRLDPPSDGGRVEARVDGGAG